MKTATEPYIEGDYKIEYMPWSEKYLVYRAYSYSEYNPSKIAWTHESTHTFLWTARRAVKKNLRLNSLGPEYYRV